MPFKKTAMKASRRLTSKKYKDDQKVKNTTSHAHIVEPQEEQVKKTQIDDFLEKVEPLSSIPNSKHKGYIALCFLKCLPILHSPIWALNRKIDKEQIKTL
jgi:hypothetical protein